jgi:zinc/manganese transport system permease protein
VCVAILFAARPLLFASLDEAVAAAAGLPVRALGIGFLVVVGITAAESTQAVGALPLLGLVAAPAAAAQMLTDRPYRALALSTAFAVGALWVGLALSYRFPQVPPSFGIVSVATATYAICLIARSRVRRIAGHQVHGHGAHEEVLR